MPEGDFHESPLLIKRVDRWDPFFHPSVSARLGGATGFIPLFIEFDEKRKCGTYRFVIRLCGMQGIAIGEHDRFSFFESLFRNQTLCQQAQGPCGTSAGVFIQFSVRGLQLTRARFRLLVVSFAQ